MWTQISKSHLRWLRMNNWVLLQALILSVSLTSFFCSWIRFISGFLHLRSPLTTMLHMQFWRVNQTPVNGFSKEVHFRGGSNSPAFSGSKENVSHVSKFVNSSVNDSLSSWLWENHSKVEDSSTFMKLNWSSVSQLSNNSQSSSKIQFCYCIFLFWWERLTEGFPAAW